MEDEPKGWRVLQKRAQLEKDPKKLAKLIDEMNQLLAEYEKAASEEEGMPLDPSVVVPSDSLASSTWVLQTYSARSVIRGCVAFDADSLPVLPP